MTWPFGVSHWYWGLKLVSKTKSAFFPTPRKRPAGTTVIAPGDSISAENDDMAIVACNPLCISGVAERKIGSVYLPAATYDVRLFGGVIGSSATMSVAIRAQGTETDLATFSSSGAPALVGPETLVVASADVFEIFSSGASETGGVAVEWLHFKVSS